MDKAKEVKRIVAQLQQKNREEQFCQRKVYRPWGWYDSLEVGRNFQVKRLNINSGARLSLQVHYKRAEHWVVVSGTATAINGDKTLILQEGDSTYIPIGVKHSLRNKTKIPLEIIEVQSGSYLGEDDIERLEDVYGRKDENV
jgi:mannose-6-phosphate isomerase-like protein (cupin superfamily)